ncbi:MAG: 30S ribosomal protein S3 [Candidatus Bathyarchaeia archaeon]|nr:30S ribosomal protein S3 [Candidatus Bathyarchaeota archaeon A05DMB-4]MDH7595610.1 30S ribosomal protein S3 [Candidatus Bathyarchaeota archaeon]
MSVVKHFITESLKRTEIDEFLRNEFERAGYGGVDVAKTPLGTHVVIYAMRPGLVIGRGGETIKELARVLEEKFQLPNPQISVAEIEVPEFNPYVVASRVTSALQRGVHFRRAGFWALRQTMDAGALGAEIVISGKLRTERARFEKFHAGYLPKSGEPALRYLRTAEMHVQLKVGILGVKVKILPPDAQFPDKVEILENVPKMEAPKPVEVKTEIQEQPQKPLEQTVEEKTEEKKTEEKPVETPKEKPAEPPKPKKKPEKKPRKTKKEKAPKKTDKEK